MPHHPAVYVQCSINQVPMEWAANHKAHSNIIFCRNREFTEVFKLAIIKLDYAALIMTSFNKRKPLCQVTGCVTRTRTVTDLTSNYLQITGLWHKIWGQQAYFSLNVAVMWKESQKIAFVAFNQRCQGRNIKEPKDQENVTLPALYVIRLVYGGHSFWWSSG